MVTSICSYFPEFGLLVVSALDGLQEEGINHLRYIMAFGLPLILIITHTEKASEVQISDCISTAISKIT